MGFRLVEVARLYRRGIDRELARVGISDAMAVPVLVLGRLGGGVRLGVLAEQLGVEAPSLLRIVDQLEEKSLVERRDDAADKRAKALHLTPAGERLAAELELVMGEVRAKLFSGIAAADLVATARVLDGLEANLRGGKS